MALTFKRLKIHTQTCHTWLKDEMNAPVSYKKSNTMIVSMAINEKGRRFSEKKWIKNPYVSVARDKFNTPFVKAIND